MKKKYLLVFGVTIAVGTILTLALVNVRSVRSGSQASTPTPSGLVTPGPTSLVNIPVPSKVTDLAPNIAAVGKATIIIRHSDGSREGFLLSVDMVDAFISQLPVGDKIDVIIPPQALIGHEPDLTLPPSGEQTYSDAPGAVIGTPPSEP